MAIDFRLTSHQRELRLESRKFAADVLANARAAELLPTPEDRFRATKPVYEAMVAAGFLRKCIPVLAGGDNAGLIDMAIMTEEFYSVDASVTLTMSGTVLGLLPILLGGTSEQASRLLKPFLKKNGAPLAGFCSAECCRQLRRLGRQGRSCVVNELKHKPAPSRSHAGRVCPFTTHRRLKQWTL